ncbi:MAG: transcription elongation factor GreA [Thermomicrobiales bacterium]
MEPRRQVTREGLEEIKQELDELINVRRPQIVATVAEARSHGDLRENSAYDAARHDQMMLERRIGELETFVRNAEVVETDTRSGVVSLGSTVIVDYEGLDETFTVVGAAEAKPALNRVSIESPIGKALIGKRVGDTATVVTPRGSSKLVVKDVIKK